MIHARRVITIFGLILGLTPSTGSLADRSSDPGTAQPTERQIPVADRQNVVLPARLLGLSGSMVWRRIAWGEPARALKPTSATAASTGMDGPQAKGYVALAPVYWSSGQKDLPLLLIVFPDFPPQPDHLSGTAPQRPSQRFSLWPFVSTDTDDTSETQESPPPRAQEPSLPSLGSPPQREHRLACSARGTGGIPGWLCLAHGQGSPLTAHADVETMGLPQPPGNSPPGPAVGLPLVELPLPRPMACESAHLAVCVAPEGPHAPGEAQ